MDSSTSSTEVTKAPPKSSHNFTWIVENFGALYLGRNRDVTKIVSPSFEVKHPQDNSVTSWCADIRVLDEYSIKANLFLISCPRKHLKADGLLTCFAIWFGTDSNPRLHGLKATYSFKTLMGYGWRRFITVEQLRSKGLLAHDDSLRVLVEMSIFARPQCRPQSCPKNDCNCDTASDGAEDEDEQEAGAALEFKFNFDFLLGNEKFSDMRITCGSEDSFPAHKSILAGRSPVLKAMLESDMKEAETGVINVTDISWPVFEILLRYMYTGKVDPAPDPDSLLEIVYGAEKYGLKELKGYCFEKLVKVISEENAGLVALAAHLYGADEKVKIAIKEFMKPKFFDLMTKEQFRKMVEKHPEAFF